MKSAIAFFAVFAIGEALAWASLTGAIYLINADIAAGHYGLEVARFMGVVALGLIGLALFVGSLPAAFEGAAAMETED